MHTRPAKVNPHPFLGLIMGGHFPGFDALSSDEGFFFSMKKAKYQK
jgi:hypothetical protein